MRKTSLFTMVGVVGLLILVIVIGATFSSHANATASLLQRTVVPYPPGVPAIKPHTSGTPAFTTTDVAQYIASQSLLRTTSGQSPKVIKSEFITAQEASTLLQGEYIGRPDNALVCYVELQGPFHTVGPLPPGATNPTLSTGYEVFDASTGNLLMYGG